MMYVTADVVESESWPQFSTDEIDAVAAVLASGRVNQWTGVLVKKFEEAFAKRCSVPYAIAVANGTVALELALRAYGVGQGDEVIVTSRSFIASASCVLSVNATPVFADVDPDSQNISPETILPHVGPNTKAVIPVHLSGWPCDMPSIMSLASARGLLVIEDCAQAVGARVAGRPVGSYGDAAAFSFCQDKIMSTGGEGGMVVFQNKEAVDWARSFKDHGKNSEYFVAPPEGNSFSYVHDSVGTNFRMTEIQAAIGLVQLTKLDEWISLRQRNAKIWEDAFRTLKCLKLPVPPESSEHAYYKFYAMLQPDEVAPGTSRAEVLNALNANGVRAFSGSCPEIYREKAFRHLDVETRPNAHHLGEWSLMFEVHPTLDANRQRARAKVAAETIKSFQKN